MQTSYLYIATEYNYSNVFHQSIKLTQKPHANARTVTPTGSAPFCAKTHTTSHSETLQMIRIYVHTTTS